MVIQPKTFVRDQFSYVIRSAKEEDAAHLAEVRLQIDGETENLDREKGEAYLSEAGFLELIKEDTDRPNHLFLVAEADNRLVGFSRCEGSNLKRFAHKAEFGIGILKAYWGHGIGKNLLKTSLEWADANAVKKMTLNVLETNDSAIQLYKKCGFEVEGVLKKDKRLSDGLYYNTIVMGRWKE
ncbi:MAG TPA: GNAT family N-acetyltransferase [Sporolactobacillaceae bacterium]|nr:GNAT family N-acetyltransferase [Sporolactobacillaceae bacterium]